MFNARIGTAGEIEMNKYWQLSSEKVNLVKDINKTRTLILSDFLSQENWDNFPIKYIKENCDWQYFILGINTRNEIAISNSSRCEIRKIENGMFKNCYAVIEKSEHLGKECSVFIAHGEGFLKLPKIKGDVTTSEIDNILNDKNMQIITAKILHKIDLSKRFQNYELFCEKMPKSCLSNSDFKNGVLKEFDNMGEMEVADVVDTSLVNLDRCAAKARSYFTNLTAEKYIEK